MIVREKSDPSLSQLLGQKVIEKMTRLCGMIAYMAIRVSLARNLWYVVVSQQGQEVRIFFQRAITALRMGAIISGETRALS